MILLLLASISLTGCAGANIGIGDNSSPKNTSESVKNEFQKLVEDFIFNALVVKDRKKIAEMTNMPEDELTQAGISYDYLLRNRAGLTNTGYQYHSVNGDKAYITWVYGNADYYVFSLRRENGKWYFNCSLDKYESFSEYKTLTCFNE
ncbi:MAG: hypothetical protein V1908_02535 [Candidatus Peregrinibacteria bacterium]